MQQILTATRRQVQRVLSHPDKYGSSHFRRLLHTDKNHVTIGDVSKAVREPCNPELVPRGYLSKNLSQWELRNLRWLMQKDIMGQDVFLIGGPGPLRRRLALSYLELTRQEAEYVTLTRDTTEADLKQRREIREATSYYHDQAAVRAAVHGRALVLDGIEKAERNVLPVLNNLLENREMSLDDGRRLIPHNRYDALEQEAGSSLSSLNVVRVSPHFRVLALGLPCPPHQGQPLDPPLRSRFQARGLEYPPFQEQLQLLQEQFPKASRDVITRCLSVAYALGSPESKALALPDYPLHLLDAAFRVLELFPYTAPESLLPLVYPHSVCLTNEAQVPVADVLQTFDLHQPPVNQTDRSSDRVESVEQVADSDLLKVAATIDGQGYSLQMQGGGLPPGPTVASPPSFIPVPQHQAALCSLLQLHAAGNDACIVGPRGCGKSAVLAEAARLLGYQLEPILLYQDMTSRDLSQQRATDSAGNTVWRPSPLLLAALEGRLAALDGLHRLHANTLAALHRLIQDRELQLFDGSRLLRHDKFDAIQSEQQLTKDEMTSRGLLRIHPSFRVVALAEPPELSTAQGQWMRPEALALMPWLQMGRPSQGQMLQLVQELVCPQSPSSPPLIQQLVELSEAVSSSSAGNLASLGQSLSLRQVVRIAKRLDQYPGHLSLHQLIQDACLARFLPPLVKQALDETLENCGIVAEAPSSASLAPQAGAADLKCTVEGDSVTIGHTTAQRYQPSSSSKVPKTLFFDIQQHVNVLESLLQDWLLGEHLLLIGNQGVGKNKLADRFLELVNRPREYLQLHRDSTVQSLTIQPCVRGGLLTHEDSPLVTAVREGSVLLLDEADKAPTHVTCVLKTLVESGEMLLSDGRRIVPPHHPLAASVVTSPQDHEDIIVSHPDFRMIVLANRPGFPFLGNDFFAVLGDLFSCHAIHNPLPSSEMALLSSYGPDVPQPLLAKLVAAFGELRALADAGTLQYPYSTREVVAVTKHLQHFPSDGVSAAIRNVLDFDSWSQEARDTAIKTLGKHGLPVDAAGPATKLATKVSLGPASYAGRWRLDRREAATVTRRSEPINYKGPLYVPTTRTELAPNEARASVFTEFHSHYSVPLYDSALITDVMTTSSDQSSSQQEQPPAARVDDLFVSGSSSRENNSSDKLDNNISSSNSSVDALRDPFEVGTKLQDAVHVASVAPLTLHTLLPSLSLTRPLIKMSLHSALPTLGGSHQPRLKLWRGTGGMVGLYEQLTNTVLLADPENREVLQLNKTSFMDKLTLPLRQLVQQETQNGCAPSGDSLMVYTRGSDAATVLDPKTGKVENLSLPVSVESVAGDGKGGWIIQDTEGARWMIGGEIGLDDMVPFHVLEGEDVSVKTMGHVNNLVMRHALNAPTDVGDLGKGTRNDTTHSPDSGTDSIGPGAVFATDSTHAVLLPGFPQTSSGAIHLWPRQENDATDSKPNRRQSNQRSHNPRSQQSPNSSDISRNCVLLPESGQVVRTLKKLPSRAPEFMKNIPAAGFLEVTDVVDRCVSYLPVPHLEEEQSEYWQWVVGRRAPNLLLAAGEGGVVSIDRAGGLRVWQVGGEGLKAGMSEWLNMVGKGDNERLELKRDSGDMSLKAPKHGKLDPNNAPHVGGNTWAGGTGGRDTAGLGGVGGPYRLDAGHDVHQVSDEVKAQVPIEVREAARKMAKAAHEKRLKEIQMSEYDHDQYEAFSKNVRSQVTQMRAVLSSLTAKAGERWWQRRRPDGELDDTALVDGLAGATNIYRQRREVPPEAGQPQTKPKRMRLLLDASGSMYRFNGHDQRLQRSLEAGLMLMEACKGHEARLIYDIYAHSGEDHAVKLCNLDTVPDNNKKRLDLLRTVLAHSQFCMSGDSTVSATKHAVDQLAKTAEDADQSFVILLSDANLDRYGISPERLATAMTAQKSVQCYAVFIGSLGNQAKRLAQALPAGRAYVCLDGGELPQIMQQIFTHAMTQ